ncbi:MAG: hypothetical protein R2769_02500 [Saprospiraceae bacterium]
MRINMDLMSASRISENNCGKWCSGSDYVNAEAQDDSGTCGNRKLET